MMNYIKSCFFLVLELMLKAYQILYILNLQHGLKTFIYLMLRIFRYRSSVIDHNIEIINNFRKDNKYHLTQLKNDYYHHLAQLIVDTIWCFGATRHQIKPKVRFENIEIFDEIYRNGHNATILLSHIGNWELFCQWAALYIPHLNVLTLYTPLKNQWLNEWILNKRSRFGVKMISTKSTLELYRAQKKYHPCINLFAVDQTPGAPYEQYWTDFLGVQTPVISGPEKFSKTFKQPVYFLHITQNQNQYILRLIPIDYDSSIDFNLTKIQMKLLEDNICINPSIWLLSHNRFKHIKP